MALTYSDQQEGYAFDRNYMLVALSTISVDLNCNECLKIACIVITNEVNFQLIGKKNCNCHSCQGSCYCILNFLPKCQSH